MKVVINSCEGGFNLSDWAFEKLIDKGWTTSTDLLDKESDIIIYHSSDTEYFLGPKWKEKIQELRTHPDLIAVIEELKEDANAEFSKLKIIEIPDEINWLLENCDGNEWVSEVHRTWS